MALWPGLVLALAFVLMLGLAVVLVRSIAGDVAMLTHSLGLVGALLVLATPTIASIVWRALVDPMHYR